MKKSESELLKPNIVIIGGGIAGLGAAVAAAEKGIEVILLEKHSKPGGNSRMALGPFAAESPVQKRNNIDARKDELFKMHMDFCKWRINPRLFRAFVDKSGDTIRWLEEKGITFKFMIHHPNQIPIVQHIPASGGGGREIIEVLSKNFEDLGGKIISETCAKDLITDKNSRVIGVVAVRDGEEFEIPTDCVVIATGGFGANRELLKKYYMAQKADFLSNAKFVGNECWS